MHPYVFICLRHASACAVCLHMLHLSFRMPRLNTHLARKVEHNLKNTKVDCAVNPIIVPIPPNTPNRF